MSEYIAKEAVQSCPIRIDHYDTVHGNEHFVLGIEFAIDYIESLPPADVEPVRHGRWVDHMCRDWRCSECGEKINKVRNVDGYCYNDKPKYCPNCGAKMDNSPEEVM